MRIGKETNEVQSPLSRLLAETKDRSACLDLSIEMAKKAIAAAKEIKAGLDELGVDPKDSGERALEMVTGLSDAPPGH